MFAWRAEARGLELEHKGADLAAANERQKDQLTEASWAAFNQADRLLGRVDAYSDDDAEAAAVREGLLLLVRSLRFNPGNVTAWQRFAWEVAARQRSLCPLSERQLGAGRVAGASAFDNQNGWRLVTYADDAAYVWDSLTPQPRLSL